MRAVPSPAVQRERYYGAGETMTTSVKHGQLLRNDEIFEIFFETLQKALEWTTPTYIYDDVCVYI